MIEPDTALVVDDHPTNRLLAAVMLRALGWQVAEAASGEAALALAAAHAPQLVLLDISMPGLSGEETCKRLRTAPDGPALHIVAYTAHAFPEDHDHLLANGFDEILVKPISHQRLEEISQRLKA